MASVVRRRRKDGTFSWYTRYRDGRGKDVWEHRASAKDARARAAEVEVELARTAGAWMPPAKTTFAEYAERWFDTHGRTLRPRTLASYRRVYRHDLELRFGPMPLAAITRAQVNAFAAERASAGAAANTIRNILGPMRVMLGAAVDDDLIRANPAAGIRRVGRPPSRGFAPDPEHVQALLSAATQAGRLPILLAATCGLRRGEIFALRWRNVDFDARSLRVEASNHGNGVVTATKTRAGHRLVPMFGTVRLALLEHSAASLYSRPDDFVICTELGTLESPNGWLKREFYPTLRRAKVPRFRFHDLRHFAVSQLIAQGANILEIARVAGHADPSITLRVYSHMMEGALARAADQYDPLRDLTTAQAGDNR